MGVSWIEFTVSDLASLNFCWSLMLVISVTKQLQRSKIISRIFFSAIGLCHENKTFHGNDQ